MFFYDEAAEKGRFSLFQQLFLRVTKKDVFLWPRYEWVSHNGLVACEAIASLVSSAFFAKDAVGMESKCGKRS
ncbi:hypothetical protein [Halalkalibacter oceani]|uniref:hypothetical protein n=1 Tax=Halalkalibacter oceani TaxID=1653776 RepID=UPI003396238C